MSKPVHGDKKHDKTALIIVDITKRVNEKFCRNQSLSTLKKLAKSYRQALVEIEDALTTKLQQSIGGIIGSRRSTRTANNLDDRINSLV